MKLFRPLILAAALCALGALGACTATGSAPPGATTAASPSQQYLNALKTATELVDQVTIAADSAVKANALKGADALTTLAALKAARDGLAVARTIANPAQALSKVNITLAALSATQAYLATLGA